MVTRFKRPPGKGLAVFPPLSVAPFSTACIMLFRPGRRVRPVGGNARGARGSVGNGTGLQGPLLRTRIPDALELFRAWANNKLGVSVAGDKPGDRVDQPGAARGLGTPCQHPAARANPGSGPPAAGTLHFPSGSAPF